MKHFLYGCLISVLWIMAVVALAGAVTGLLIKYLYGL